MSAASSRASVPDLAIRRESEVGGGGELWSGELRGGAQRTAQVRVCAATCRERSRS